jgi:hypothetical protein
MKRIFLHLFCALAFGVSAAHAFVYENVFEFQSDGDFDGDGRFSHGFPRAPAALPTPPVSALASSVRSVSIRSPSPDRMQTAST